MAATYRGEERRREDAGWTGQERRSRFAPSAGGQLLEGQEARVLDVVGDPAVGVLEPGLQRQDVHGDALRPFAVPLADRR